MRKPRDNPGHRRTARRVFASGAERVRERGASALEFAIILPTLIIMIFGIIETGFLVKDLVAVRNAAEEGVRAGAVGANSATSDFKILAAVEAHLGASEKEIVRIVVYKASGPGAPPSASCKAGVPGLTEKCNVYTKADFDLASNQFGCLGASPDKNYCPTTRDVTLENPDWLGVYIKAHHPGISGLFSGTLDLERIAVFPLERGGSI